MEQVWVREWDMVETDKRVYKKAYASLMYNEWGSAVESEYKMSYERY